MTIRRTLIVAMAIFLFSVALPARAGCCITPSPSTCVTINSEIQCNQITGQWSGRDCSAIASCTSLGKCINNSTGACENTRKLDCDGRGPRYTFFVGQKCGVAGEAGTCCLLYTSGSGRIDCLGTLSSQLQCLAQQQPNITVTWHPDQACSSVPNCPQSAAIGPEPTSKSETKTVFKPSITIPGSKFLAGQEIVVTGRTLGEYIAAFYAFFVGIIGVLAVVMILWGAIQWIAAAGNVGKIGAAKEQISSAIIGLILALAAYAILNFISSRLVEFRDLTSILTIVQRVEQPLGGEELVTKGRPPVVWNGKNVTKWDILLTQYARQANIVVDRDWLKAIMLVESAGNPDAVSDAYACGLMQVLPIEPVTCEQLKNPEKGIEAGTTILHSLITLTCPTSAKRKSGEEVTCDPSDTFCTKGDYHYAVAAYNGGLGANCSSIEKICVKQTWWECEVNAGFQETRDYVEKVTQAHTKITTDPNFTWTVP